MASLKTGIWPVLSMSVGSVNFTIHICHILWVRPCFTISGSTQWGYRVIWNDNWNYRGESGKASPLFFVQSAFHLHDKAYRNRSIDKNETTYLGSELITERIFGNFYSIRCSDADVRIGPMTAQRATCAPLSGRACKDADPRPHLRTRFLSICTRSVKIRQYRLHCLQNYHSN